MSFPLRQWKYPVINEDIVASLAGELKVSVSVARILVARGFSDTVSARRFLNPRLSDLADPFVLPDMDVAVNRIWIAIDNKQKIVVFGDYDVDGITSTALMVEVLKALGADAVPFIPHRIDDGYGMSVEPLKRCIEAHRPALIITVDCGTNSVEASDLARASGIDVIVTDHHEPHGVLAHVYALVNPRMGTDESAWTLAGVGVAFKLCHGIVKMGLQNQKAEVSHIDLRDWLDLVAIGTVADVVPLIDENRIFVRHGISRIHPIAGNKGKKRLGLDALIDVAGIKGLVDCYHIGFVIGPRLNAAGRLGSAESALNLLITEDPDCAVKLAYELEKANKDRKALEDRIKNEAQCQIEEYFDSKKIYGLVVSSAGWHVGVNGIVASRLSSTFRRPVIVITIDEHGNGHGSCRSIECLDILEILDECADLLVGYGGHKMAAGLEILAENIDAFRDRFNDMCTIRLAGVDLRLSLNVDAWVNMCDLDSSLLEELLQLAPHGNGNSLPLLGVKGVRLAGPPVMMGKNKEHLRLTVVKGGTQIEAVGFGMGRHQIPDGEMDVVFNLKNNNYRGRSMLQMNIQDLRGS